MIGSACFALGAVPGYAGADGGTADGGTFFVGSLFFTAAACGQFLQSNNGRKRGHRDKGWWAAAVQLAGTLFFNASTLHALTSSLSAAQQDRLVWRPDAYGSGGLLMARGLALRAPSGPRRAPPPPGSPSGVAVVNKAGAVGVRVAPVGSVLGAATRHAPR